MVTVFPGRGSAAGSSVQRARPTGAAADRPRLRGAYRVDNDLSQRAEARARRRSSDVADGDASAVSGSAMLAEVPYQLTRLEPDMQHRVSRLRQCALVIWTRTMSEDANVLDGFDQFHVVLGCG